MIEQPPGERRRARARPGSIDDSRRAKAQAHLDGRQARLQAYADSLTAALAAGAPAAQRERMKRELAQVQRDVRSASRRRIPQARSEPRPAQSGTAATDLPADAAADAAPPVPDTSG